MQGKVWVAVSSDGLQVAAVIRCSTVRQLPYCGLCRVGQLLCFHVCLLCSVSGALVYNWRMRVLYLPKH